MRRSIAVSALEHTAYCHRQAALIHTDRYFESNADTIRGDLAHQTVDTPGGETRLQVHTERRLPIWSKRYRIHGYCDVVEIAADKVMPVEHKSGATFHGAAAVQLCAQALCLEEMFKTHVAAGAIYLTATRKRHYIDLTPQLRCETERVIGEAHQLLNDERLPDARNDIACRACSLRPGCLPHLVADPQRVGGLASATWRP